MSGWTIVLVIAVIIVGVVMTIGRLRLAKNFVRSDPSVPEFARALRAVVAGSQGAFLRAVEEHPDAVLLRVDALEHVRAVAWWWLRRPRGRR